MMIPIGNEKEVARITVFASVLPGQEPFRICSPETPRYAGNAVSHLILHPYGFVSGTKEYCKYPLVIKPATDVRELIVGYTNDRIITSTSIETGNEQ